MRARAAKSQRYEPPKVGDYVVQNPFLHSRHWVVERKTTDMWGIGDRVTACETEHGARNLAALLNQARDLGDNWSSISTWSGWNNDRELWARNIIARSVLKALGLEINPETPWEFQKVHEQNESAQQGAEP